MPWALDNIPCYRRKRLPKAMTRHRMLTFRVRIYALSTHMFLLACPGHTRIISHTLLCVHVQPLFFIWLSFVSHALMHLFPSCRLSAGSVALYVYSIISPAYVRIPNISIDCVYFIYESGVHVIIGTRTLFQDTKSRGCAICIIGLRTSPFLGNRSPEGYLLTELAS